MTTPLHDLLKQHQIPQSILSQIVQRNGKGLSKSAISQLVNQGKLPKTTSRNAIELQIRNLLNQHGIEAVPDLFGDGDDTADTQTELEEKPMLSQAAKQQFKLFRQPFMDDVRNADDVFWSPEQYYIRGAMHDAAKNGGFMAIIGESGAGKSTLREDLLESARLEGWAITFIQPRCIDKTRLTAGSICDAIIQDVSIEAPKRSLEAKSRQVEKLLIGSCQAGNKHCLLIEEAHDLDIRTIKYLKRFWELKFGFERLLSIILIGQPELKPKLNEKRNWEAREVIRRLEIAELLPLGKDIKPYLALKFKRIGRELSEIFEDDAFDAMRAALHKSQNGEHISMSYPLIVNNLAIRCLNKAAELGQLVDQDVVKEVWK